MKTEAELRKAGLEILRREIGVVDAVRFIQLFEPGQGDYTRERQDNANAQTADKGKMTANV